MPCIQPTHPSHPTQTTQPPPGTYDQIYRAVLADGSTFVDTTPSMVREGDAWVPNPFPRKWAQLMAAARVYHQYPSLLQHLSAAMGDGDAPPTVTHLEILDVATNECDLRRRFERYYRKGHHHCKNRVIPNNLWEYQWRGCEETGEGDDDAEGEETEADACPELEDAVHDDGTRAWYGDYWGCESGDGDGDRGGVVETS